jgi:hypothetical protein
MNRRTLVGVFVSAVMIGGLVLSPVHARAGEDIEKKIATAKTAADHEAIAAHFDKEAKAAEAKAKYHTEMGAAYKKMGGAVITKNHADQHCSAIAASYEAIAKENAALAEAHRAQAK